MYIVQTPSKEILMDCIDGKPVEICRMEDMDIALRWYNILSYAAQFPDKRAVINEIIWEHPETHEKRTLKEVFEGYGVSEDRFVKMLIEIEKSGMTPDKKFVKALKRNHGWV